MKDYRRALNRLYSLEPGKMMQGRDRLHKLLQHAGNPHLAMPTVLVGGTNGKGSVVAGLSAVLSTQMTTGAFVKPHLKSIRERWRVNDQPVLSQTLINAINRTCDLIERHDTPISFFEANVLVGALCFVESDCAIAVWEVGLGGAEDACNLVEPIVSVITNAGYDHQAILGNTLPEIALDKAGIARSGKPLLLGPPRPGWNDAYSQYRDVVKIRAEELGACFIEVNASTTTKMDVDPFCVPVQPDTEALIHATMIELQQANIVDPDANVSESLSGFHYRGRLELTHLCNHPVILDAAHNVDSLRFLANAINRRFDCKVPVVFGCQATRNPFELLEEIREIAGVLIPVAIPVLKPCSVESIANAAKQHGLAISLPSLPEMGNESREFSVGHITELDPPDNSTMWIESVEHALSLATPDAPCLICGSIYYLGEILRVFEK